MDNKYIWNNNSIYYEEKEKEVIQNKDEGRRQIAT